MLPISVNLSLITLQPVSRTKNSHVPPTFRLQLTPCDRTSAPSNLLPFRMYPGNEEKPSASSCQPYENGGTSPISENHTISLRASVYHMQEYIMAKNHGPFIKDCVIIESNSGCLDILQSTNL